MSNFFKFLNQINENLMLDYSKQLLESSSTQKLSQISEHRVLDAREWNH